jgi:N-methylhydantoinase A
VGIKVCIDVGGTFTDASMVDEKCDIRIFKSLSTPPDYVQGIIDVLKVAAEYYSKSLDEFMKSCSTLIGGSLVHGTTITTNAMLEGNVAKVGLICTKGQRDMLTFREGGKEDSYDWMMDYPEPYVPRYLTIPVTERINSEGEVEIPLSEYEVRQALRQLRQWNVESVAVCLLWSIENSIHECRISEIAKEEFPEVPCVLSSEVNPCIREYRRCVSTAIDASLRPLASTYIANFEKCLKDIGYQGELNMLTSAGGAMSAKELIGRPILSVDCGPALAPFAGKEYSEKEMGIDDVITVDMGGTSFDVSCMSRGKIAVSRESKMGDDLLGISKVDTRSIGAGGGSIAWIDVAGLIHVGPKSAGSNPGPACYMRGGTEPTVSDANVVMGYLDPDYFLGGRMKLDAKLAEEVINAKVSGILKISVEEAAFTITATTNANMAGAIRDITIWQGIDPREYLLVGGGGAFGLHCVPIMQELEMQKALIPKTASALSATGGVFADLVAEYSRSCYTDTSVFDYGGVRETMDYLMGEAHKFLDRNRVPIERRELEFSVEARYPYQVWELPVSLTGISLTNEEGVAKLVERFHEEHERVFAIKEPGVHIECLFWKVRAIGKGVVGQVKLKEMEFRNRKPSSKALIGKRKAYFKELGGMVETPIYLGEELGYGNELSGPAVIEEPTTTIVLPPRSMATVQKFGSYYIEA